MQIVVRADKKQQEEFLLKPITNGVHIIWQIDHNDIPEADAYFDLLFEEEGPCFSAITEKPVFVNAVITLGTSLANNCFRINAWNGFLKREIIELVETESINTFRVNDILEKMGWKYQLVPDCTGMIAARVIAMIINEAYFGLGDNISTKKEIDIAMKLGTNYPMGPFEWCEKIGIHKIYALLQKLYETDIRYAIAPALEKEMANKK